VDWNKNHTDITNHYIKMGVIGGLPLMLMFIGVVITGFKTVGEALRASKDLPPEKRFVIWIFGAILLGHALTFVSVCYFDQSIVFFLLILAIIGSLRTKRMVSNPILPQGAPATAN
jgi:Na+/phosphate symporter